MGSRVKNWVRSIGESKAVTSLEYGLIAGVLVLTILLGFNVLGSHVSTKFNSIAAKLT